MNIAFSIDQKIGEISQKGTGWTKELNIVNWNNRGAKFDIREWNPEHDKMGKGITLTEDELYNLYGILKEYFHEESPTITHQDHDDILKVFLK